MPSFRLICVHQRYTRTRDWACWSSRSVLRKQVNSPRSFRHFHRCYRAIEDEDRSQDNRSSLENSSHYFEIPGIQQNNQIYHLDELSTSAKRAKQSLSSLTEHRDPRAVLAPDDAYPWNKHTLASYTPVFDVHNGCLCSFAYHSSIKALLNRDLFKTVHVIIFLSNMDLGQVHVTAAHTDSVIPTFVLKEVRDEPGVYAFQFDASVDLGEGA